MLQMNGAERKRVADSHSNIFNHLGNDVCPRHLYGVSKQPLDPIARLSVLLTQDDESALDDQMNKVSCRGI